MLTGLKINKYTCIFCLKLEVGPNYDPTKNEQSAATADGASLCSAANYLEGTDSARKTLIKLNYRCLACSDHCHLLYFYSLVK